MNPHIFEQMLTGAAFCMGIIIMLLLLKYGKHIKHVDFKAGALGASIDLQEIKETLREVKERTDETNKAVNHVPDGTHTLVERVATVENDLTQFLRDFKDHRVEEREALDALQAGIDHIARHVGATINAPMRLTTKPKGKK